MATSFLDRTITRIREELDEPSTNPKYSDSRLIDYIEMAYASVFQEINRISDKAIIPYLDISITTDTYVYELPPIIHKIIEIVEVSENSDDDTYISMWTPTTVQSAAWPGMTLQGNTIRFMRGHKPDYDFTMRVYFMPSGCARLHTSEIAGNALTNDTDNNNAVITLDSAPDTGTFDNRPNAYVGSIFRTINASKNNYVIDRIITAFDVSTGQITVQPAFDEDLGIPGDEDAGETITYEIAPPFSEALDWQIGLAVAEHIASFERDTQRIGLIHRQFQKKARDARLSHAHYNTITAKSMTNTNPRNFNTIPSRFQNLNDIPRY
jgi:hypothetical protein